MLISKWRCPMIQESRSIYSQYQYITVGNRCRKEQRKYIPSNRPSRSLSCHLSHRLQELALDRYLMLASFTVGAGLCHSTSVPVCWSKSLRPALLAVLRKPTLNRTRALVIISINCPWRKLSENNAINFARHPSALKAPGHLFYLSLGPPVLIFLDARRSHLS